MTANPLRISADDPGVLTRTGEALDASTRVAKPSLRLKCSQCGNLLAQVSDVPDYGPLFVSSWPVETNEHTVVVNGRELKGRERRNWFAKNYETL